MPRSTKLQAALDAITNATRSAVQAALDEPELDQSLINKLADLHGRAIAIKSPPPPPPPAKK